MAEAVFQGIYPLLKERGIYLAAQCCEHLNRAIILEKEAARAYGYPMVNVVPNPKPAAALLQRRGAIWNTRWRWNTYRLRQAWISAAP